MARARNIKPSFFTDDELAELPPLARLLFAGLWCIADREGRLVDKPSKIKALVLPYSHSSVNTLLCKLNAARFITRYECDGQRYIQIRQFAKHQNPHVKEPKSTIPAPGSAPGSTPTQHRTSPGNSGTSRADSGFLIPLSPPPNPPPARAPDEVAANGKGSKVRRVLEREQPKSETRTAEDPWPRRIPEITEQHALDECAKAYGIDVKARHFGSYAELQTACFTARNQLREERERDHARH